MDHLSGATVLTTFPVSKKISPVFQIRNSRLSNLRLAPVTAAPLRRRLSYEPNVPRSQIKHKYSADTVVDYSTTVSCYEDFVSGLVGDSDLIELAAEMLGFRPAFDMQAIAQLRRRRAFARAKRLRTFVWMRTVMRAAAAKLVELVRVGKAFFPASWMLRHGFFWACVRAADLEFCEGCREAAELMKPASVPGDLESQSVPFPRFVEDFQIPAVPEPMPMNVWYASTLGVSISEDQFERLYRLCRHVFFEDTAVMMACPFNWSDVVDEYTQYCFCRWVVHTAISLNPTVYGRDMWVRFCADMPDDLEPRQFWERWAIDHHDQGEVFWKDSQYGALSREYVYGWQDVLAENWNVFDEDFDELPADLQAQGWGLVPESDKTYLDDKVKELRQTFEGLTEQFDAATKNRADELRETLMRSIAEQRTLVSESLASATASATSGWDRVRTDVMSLLWYVPLGVGVLYILKVCKVDLMLRDLLKSVLSALLPVYIWDRISCYFEDGAVSAVHSIESQACAPDFFKQIGGLVSAIFTCITFKDGVKFVNLDNIQRNMTMYERASSGWGEFIGFATRCFEYCYNRIAEYFGSSNIKLTESGHEEVEKFCTRVSVLECYLREGRPADTAFALRVQKLASDKQVMDVKVRWRMLQPALAVYNDAVKRLDNICKRAAPALSEVSTTRVEPVAVMIQAGAGVGKSLLAPLALQYVLERVLNDEQKFEIDFKFSKEIFCKSKSEYWEGYHGETAYVIDDFAQKKNVTGADADDFMEFITVTNTWKCPLNMAFAEKGLAFFSSKLVWCTTNVKNMRHRASEMICEPEAVRRRFKFYKKLILKSEYAIMEPLVKEIHGGEPVQSMSMRSTDKLDHSKWEAACIERGQIVWDAWQVVDCDFESGVAVGVAQPFEDFLKDVVAEYRRRHVDREDLLSKLAVGGKFSTIVPQALEIEPIAEGEEFENPFATTAAVGGVIEEDIWYGSVVSTFSVESKQSVGRVSDFFAKTLLSFRNWVVANPMASLCLKYGGVLVLLLLALKGAMAGFSVLAAKWTRPAHVFTKEQMAAAAAMSSDEKDIMFLLAASYKAKPIDASLSDESFQAFTQHLKDNSAARIKIAALTKVASESGNREPNKGLLQGLVPKPASVAQGGVPEPSADQQSVDIAAKASKNTWQLSVSLNAQAEELKLGHALAVRERIFMFPFHFISMIEKLRKSGRCSLQDCLVFRNVVNPALNCVVSLSDFLSYESVSEVHHDLIFFRFPSLNCACDLTRHFVRRADVVPKDYIAVRVECTGALQRIDEKVLRVEKYSKTGRVGDMMSYRDPNSDTDITVDGHVRYDMATNNGDCGSPVYLANKPSTEGRKLLGVHIAGSPKEQVGYASLVTQEFLEKVYAKFPAIVSQSADWEGMAIAVEPALFGSVTQVATISEGYSTSSKSSLHHSKLYGAWGPDMKAPARLGLFKDKEGNEVDPQGLATSVYGGPLLVLNSRKVGRAAHTAFAPLFEASANEPREVLTFEVACAGVAGEPYRRGLKRSKSPGYPYNLRGFKDKKKFFGKDGEFDFTSPECAALRADVDGLIEDAKKGVRRMHVYTDFLKDELRGVQKVAEGKTRLISGAPLAYVIAFRMYFMSWMVAVQKHGLKCGVAIGINPYKDWPELVRRLQSKGPSVFAGDYKSFDANERPQIHDAILDQIDAWYALGGDTEEAKRIRHVLWQEVSFSRHLGGVGQPRRSIFQWFGSLPSGHPATSIINSYYNLILFALCWEDVLGMHLAHRFWDFVYVCTYGDDNVANVAIEVRHLFNQNTVADAMLKYGQTYTREDKISAIQTDYRTIEQVSFLKRSFRREDGMWFAPKELESTLYTPYWLSSKVTPDLVTRDVLEETLAELSLHDAAVWAQWFPQIAKAAWDRLQYVPRLASREDYLDLIGAQEYEW